jgi:DNA-3-methyladenine glycosylase II
MEYLTRIKGVGKWTVEMILIFTLKRPDVFSAGDLGIQQAMKKLYALNEEGRDLIRRMETIAAPWSPDRSLACRYLWKWKDGQY